jgi:hypothetical protein
MTTFGRAITAAAVFALVIVAFTAWAVLGAPY